MNLGSSAASAGNSAGALTELVALGAIDVYLSADAQFTYFRLRYQRYSNFAMESVVQPFSGHAFGSQQSLTLNRSGDLVYFMYVVIDIPGITACVPGDSNTCTAWGGQNLSGGNPFPTPYGLNDTSGCSPCRENDNDVYSTFLTDTEIEAAIAAQAAGNTTAIGDKLAEGKQRWLKDRYGGCRAPGCCENVEDCASDCCPDLHTDDPSKNVPYAYWTNTIGQVIVQSAWISIGGTNIDILYSEFLFAWEELAGVAGKRLREMIGKRDSRAQLVCDSSQRRTLYVPLPFWFTQHSGQSLSLASLQFHTVQVHVHFRRLEECILCSDTTAVVKNCQTGCCIGSNDIGASLETLYIYLDSKERDRFSQAQFENLITQTQFTHVQSCNSQIRTQINFNHPILELIFMVRRQCVETANSWFNFSGVDGRDPIVRAALSLNNQPRFNKTGEWFRTVVPYQFHNLIPDSYVYNYCFALHPQSQSPSGSCNFSRIDHVDFQVALQDGLGREQVTLLVFARNWNVLRFRDGLGGLAYSASLLASVPAGIGF
jgi:hypothetical protein